MLSYKEILDIQRQLLSQNTSPEDMLIRLNTVTIDEIVGQVDKKYGIEVIHIDGRGDPCVILRTSHFPECGILLNTRPLVEPRRSGTGVITFDLGDVFSRPVEVQCLCCVYQWAGREAYQGAAEVFLRSLEFHCLSKSIEILIASKFVYLSSDFRPLSKEIKLYCLGEAFTPDRDFRKQPFTGRLMESFSFLRWVGRENYPETYPFDSPNW